MQLYQWILSGRILPLKLYMEAGAHIINDISGGDADNKMFSIVERLNVPYIMMHMKGDAGNNAEQSGL